MKSLSSVLLVAAAFAMTACTENQQQPNTVLPATAPTTVTSVPTTPSPGVVVVNNDSSGLSAGEAAVAGAVAGAAIGHLATKASSNNTVNTVTSAPQPPVREVHHYHTKTIVKKEKVKYVTKPSTSVSKTTSPKPISLTKK